MGFLRTTFLVAIAAIVITKIPTLFTPKLPVIIGGKVEPGFEGVLDTFRANYESGLELPESGSAFAVYYKGRKVVDIWGGYADAEALQPWKNDTMAVVFSVTKGMAALCMAILSDRGQLQYDERVAHYWPEFGQNDKEDVTVRMLLNHEAGLAMTDPPLSIELLKHYEELGNVLAASPPMWQPGTEHGYHAITFSLYASQLLSRVDPQHRTLGQFFKEEVAEPFGIEFYIGLPSELNYRVSRFFTASTNLFLMMWTSLADPVNRRLFWDMFVSGESILPAVIENCGDVCDNMYRLNDPDYRAIEMGSHSGIGTANGLAKVYSILANGGKTKDGKTLLSEQMIKQLVNGANASRKDKVIGASSKYSTGFTYLQFKDRELFGHPGAGGNMAYTDIENQLGVAYVTRYQSAYGFGNDPRFVALQIALQNCVSKLNG
ncbi:beta-lactamase domain-containing protein 2-like [Amphiura filiformis]|uniref:beta-lactamase domain-containing protein 2-like n=1 Tax=Amphiura filiformis TaxID=82378 RepID=UPI003B2149B5